MTPTSTHPCAPARLSFFQTPLRRVFLAMVFALGAVSAQAATLIVPGSSNDGDFGKVSVGSVTTKSFSFEFQTDILERVSITWRFGSLSSNFEQSNIAGCSTGQLCSFDLTYTPVAAQLVNENFAVRVGYTTKTSAAGQTASLINLTAQAGTIGKPKPPTTPGTVPLPAGGVLILTGLAGFAALRRRKMRAAQL